ncbi:hypothetical protein OSTOST_24474 [Ostertagia ostertagi]
MEVEVVADEVVRVQMIATVGVIEIESVMTVEVAREEVKEIVTETGEIDATDSCGCSVEYSP